MLIDEVTIRIIAGKGGNGCVAFDKSKGGRGPTGASGGRGGDVYMAATSNLNALGKFRFKKEFEAEDGKDGQNRLLDGRNGEDLILEVPIGTIAHNLVTHRDFEIMIPNDKIQLARGGKGGRGNWSFRSSTNTTPKESEQGRPGQEFDCTLELNLIAQVGFIGFPSAGKSSLLNALTKADAKVAAYPFTTLEPNLGDFYGLIIADIPGLIEGASEGKGLGTRFLRHIKRTNILIHCLSAESDDLKRDYDIIRKELVKYEPELAEKKEYIFLTKTDLISAEEKEKKIKELKKINPDVLALSIYDFDALEEVKKLLTKIKDDAGIKI
ncbi:MAG: GTPase ObgE [Candidatus Paceibacterota bacterium]